MPKYQAIEVVRVYHTDEGPEKINSFCVLCTNFSKVVWQLCCQQCEEMD